MAFFILFFTHIYSTIKFLEAAGFGATERFPLTGFLRLSLRICHLQTWRSVTAYFLGDWRRCFLILGNSRQSIEFGVSIPYENRPKPCHAATEILTQQKWCTALQFDITVLCGQELPASEKREKIDLLVWDTFEKLVLKDLNTCQNPKMRPDLCPHILLPLDEQACGAINQTQHGRHILLSLGQAQLHLLSLRGTNSHSAVYLWNYSAEMQSNFCIKLLHKLVH